MQLAHEMIFRVLKDKSHPFWVPVKSGFVREKRGNCPCFQTSTQHTCFCKVYLGITKVNGCFGVLKKEETAERTRRIWREGKNLWRHRTGNREGASKFNISDWKEKHQRYFRGAIYSIEQKLLSLRGVCLIFKATEQSCFLQADILSANLEEQLLCFTVVWILRQGWCAFDGIISCLSATFQITTWIMSPLIKATSSSGFRSRNKQDKSYRGVETPQLFRSRRTTSRSTFFARFFSFFSHCNLPNYLIKRNQFL